MNQVPPDRQPEEEEEEEDDDDDNENEEDENKENRGDEVLETNWLLETTVTIDHTVWVEPFYSNKDAIAWKNQRKLIFSHASS